MAKQTQTTYFAPFDIVDGFGNLIVAANATTTHAILLAAGVDIEALTSIGSLTLTAASTTTLATGETAGDLPN